MPASSRLQSTLHEKYNSPQVPSQALLAAIRESLSAMWFQKQQDPGFVIRFTALWPTWSCPLPLDTKCFIRSFTLGFLLFLRTQETKVNDLEAGAPPRTEQLEQEARSCYLLAEWVWGSQVALLHLHSHICKVGSLPQSLCMEEAQYSPKSVSFCEGTWGEDSYTRDLLRGVLSGDTRLLGRKGEGAEQELKFPANIQPPPDPMGSSRAKLYLKQLLELRQKTLGFHSPTPVHL